MKLEMNMNNFHVVQVNLQYNDFLSIYLYLPFFFFAAPSTNHIHLSSALPEIDPDTAYVVCISVSFGFRQKLSDKALLSVIALTTFNCIVSASVTKGALVCFVVTVHWWRHGPHYDITEANSALCNILTVHLNNGATRADLRGMPKHWEVTAKAGRQSTIYTGDFDAIFSIIRYGTNPHIHILAFYSPDAVLGTLNS